jgi:UDP-N-acetylmuramoyl-tripeptide--D-alanyl-D-alanine ligase
VGFFFKITAMKTIPELHQLFLQYKNIFTDSRKASMGGIFFALKGDRFDGNLFAEQAIIDGANFAVVDNPKLASNPNCIVVDDVLSTLQRLANYHRKTMPYPILAITGTNGKTTTKELIAEVLRRKFNVLATQGNLNNHIGVPLTLLSLTPEHEIAIVEMGANHQGEIAQLCNIAEPDYGIITNVGKAHLEGFGSFEGVVKTKGELYRHISQHGKGIFRNAENQHLAQIAPTNVANYTYGLIPTDAQLKGEIASNDYYVTGKVLFEKGWLYLRSKLTGGYNMENILAAARIGLHFGVDPLKIQEAIESYTPSNSRSQILKIGSNTILLDCYNANPSSMEVSIRNFMEIQRSGKIIILGDMLELGEVSHLEHQKVVDQLASGSFEQVFLVGSNFMSTYTPEHFTKVNEVTELELIFTIKNFSGKFLFIKGSRGIRLEKVLDCIKEKDQQ